MADQPPTIHNIITAVVAGELDSVLDRIALAVESRRVVLDSQQQQQQAPQVFACVRGNVARRTGDGWNASSISD